MLTCGISRRPIVSLVSHARLDFAQHFVTYCILGVESFVPPFVVVDDDDDASIFQLVPSSGASRAHRIKSRLSDSRPTHIVMTKKTKPARTNNKKKKVAPTNRATTRAALAKTPTGGKKSAPTASTKTPNGKAAPKTPKTPKTPKSVSNGGVKKHRSSAKKSGTKRATPKKPMNTTGYIMNQRKYGAQPQTPRPLSSMKSPRLETIATATMKPPASGIDMFGSMIGAVSPSAARKEENGLSDGMSSEVIKLCSIITEQAKTIERLESELNNVRAQLQARMVAPVPTLRRVPSTTSELASRIAGLFKREK